MGHFRSAWLAPPPPPPEEEEEEEEKPQSATHRPNLPCLSTNITQSRPPVTRARTAGGRELASRGTQVTSHRANARSRARMSSAQERSPPLLTVPSSWRLLRGSRASAIPCH